MADYKYREEWLAAAVEQIRPWFPDSHPLPAQIRVSVGFASRAPRKVLGQCHYSALDGIKQVYISPMQEKPGEILSTLMHELCHSVFDVGIAHTTPFKRLGIQMGLIGKPTEMRAGEELQARLDALLPVLGPLPHSALTLLDIKKQSTLMLKAHCEECGYTVRVAKKWLDIALPTCTVCEEQMIEG